MAQALKHIFSNEFYTFFLEHFSDIYPLDSQKFMISIFDAEWEHKALKERITHTAHVLHDCINATYKETVDFFITYCNKITHLQNSEWGLASMFIPEYLRIYGIHDYETSMYAIEHITKHTSCEFAIREFIQVYPEKTMKQMLKWSTHSHPAVRRLASEGCRSRLPWATQIPEFRKNQDRIIPILENLKADESVFVRKSVANSLNDISKDNPQLALALCSEWKGFHKHTDWIIKHGLRTLLKQGNKEAFKLCGLSTSTACELKELGLQGASVNDSTPLHIWFKVTNTSTKKEKCRFEYALYFLRKNGDYSRKVFFIRETELHAKTTMYIEKKHSFIARTKRLYYQGIQYVSCIVNGMESKKMAFNLMVQPHDR